MASKAPAWSWFTLKKKEKEEEEKEFIPDNCAFCGIKIESEDVYWLGIDRYNICAASCNSARCKMWFEQKVKRQKE